LTEPGTSHPRFHEIELPAITPADNVGKDESLLLRRLLRSDNKSHFPFSQLGKDKQGGNKFQYSLSQ
jgi:hypothetical protein